MKQNDRRREFKNTKSRAGRRSIGLRDPIIKLLREHQDAQAWERKQAGDEWEDKGCVFAQPTGARSFRIPTTSTGRSSGRRGRAGRPSS